MFMFMPAKLSTVKTNLCIYSPPAKSTTLGLSFLNRLFDMNCSQNAVKWGVIQLARFWSLLHYCKTRATLWWNHFSFPSRYGSNHKSFAEDFRYWLICIPSTKEMSISTFNVQFHVYLSYILLAIFSLWNFILWLHMSSTALIQQL